MRNPPPTEDPSEVEQQESDRGATREDNRSDPPLEEITSRRSTTTKAPAAPAEFQNRYVRGRVTMLSVSQDKRLATLSLQLENVSDDPLGLAFKTSGDWDGTSLIDDTGSDIEPQEVTGIPYMYERRSRRREESYVVVDPDSFVTILYKYSSREGIQGSRFSFTSEFFVDRGGGERSRFSLGISNLSAGSN